MLLLFSNAYCLLVVYGMRTYNLYNLKHTIKHYIIYIYYVSVGL